MEFFRLLKLRLLGFKSLGFRSLKFKSLGFRLLEFESLELRSLKLRLLELRLLLGLKLLRLRLLVLLFCLFSFSCVSAAYAAGSGFLGGDILSFLPLIAICGVFYFMLIRPQQKKAQLHKAMINAVRRGDKVITAGGVIGVVVRNISDDRVLVSIAEGVMIEVVKSTLSHVWPKDGSSGENNRRDNRQDNQRDKSALKSVLSDRDITTICDESATDVAGSVNMDNMGNAGSVGNADNMMKKVVTNTGKAVARQKTGKLLPHKKSTK